MAAVKPNALPWLLVSVLVLVLDQWTKAWVLSSLPEYTAVPVIEGFWNWYRTYNTGAAFSFLADAGGWQKYFFVAHVDRRAQGFDGTLDDLDGAVDAGAETSGIGEQDVHAEITSHRAWACPRTSQTAQCRWHRRPPRCPRY